jgi:hypothetical protein
MTIVSKRTLAAYIVARISALAGGFSMENTDSAGNGENDRLAGHPRSLCLPGERAAF